MGSSYHQAVSQLLAEQGGRLPDWSGITVLVPHHHLVPGFLAAMHQQVDVPVFLPPCFATLPALALPGDPTVQPNGQRLAALYAFLLSTDWIDEAARWPLAQAMLDLLDEMDDALLAPPVDYRGFAAQVEQATRRALAAPLEREARLVFEIWRAFHQAGPGIRAGLAQGLARWLEQASGPLYAFGLGGTSRLEARFLADCRAGPGLVDLPVAEPHPARRALFEAAWHDAGAALRERALAWPARHPASPLALDLMPLPDLEAEAQVVAARVRAWLAEGRRAIAVIALDRLAARRLRAVLERDHILLQDETGWTFATATVSHLIDRWFALLQDGCYHRDLFDLMKSPFVFADLDGARRLAAVAELEHLTARHNVVAGLDRFLSLAGDGAARPLLERLAEALRLYRRAGRRTLAAWLDTLFQALDLIGALPACAADPAGRQLLDLLRRLTGELAGERATYGLAQWRGWLDLHLDRTTFVDDAIDSPVRLTHLAAARMRDFEAVAVLGADADHLPPAGAGELFADAVRVQLGLPGQRQRRDETLAHLIDVLSRADQVLVTWQAWRGAEPNPTSPWLVRLAAFHRLAYGDDLMRAASAEPPAPATAPPPPVPARLAELPARLSASAWQAMIDCPYRWFARQGLGLGEAVAVEEAMEKAGYGERVHDILRRFHTARPVLAAVSRATLEAELDALTATVFRSGEHDDYLALAWRLRWEKRIPAYLDWALAREAAGYAWRESEASIERPMTLPDGSSVTLYGRLDRLDDGPDGSEVLDYKTTALQALRGRLKVPGEAVQLAFYGLLSGAARAGLVALDDDTGVDVAEMQRPLAEAAAAEEERLADVLARLAGGAALPAHGAPDTCRWCEMRGLCRRA